MIRVEDNFLPEDVFERFRRDMEGLSMRYGWKANKDTDPHGHWNRDLGLVKSENLANISSRLLGPVKESWEYLIENVPEIKDNLLVRFYMNGHTYGVDGYYHVDTKRKDETTIIVYLNETWDKDWGGETFFVDSNDDIIKGVLPKKNRVVIFDSNIQHCARGVSRKFNGIRRTFMFKSRKQRSFRFERLSSWLFNHKATDLPHANGSLHDHLVRTYQLLEDKGIEKEICLAGGLHSVFGTKYYQNSLIPVTHKDYITNQFGDKVSNLVLLFYQIDRPDVLENPTMEGSEYLLRTVNGPSLNVSEEDFVALRLIECANLIDQESLDINKYPNLHAFWNSQLQTNLK